MGNVPQSPGSARWRKSTYSNGHGACVECAPGPGTVWRKATAIIGNGACVEVAGWQKSSHSQAGECVEVATGKPGGVYVRDSKLGDTSPILTFTAADWQSFLNGLKTSPPEVLA